MGFVGTPLMKNGEDADGRHSATPRIALSSSSRLPRACTRGAIRPLKLATSSVRSNWQSLRAVWDKLSLSLKFILTASIVVTIGMSVIGSWVAGRIKDGVVDNAAQTAGSYVVNYISPHLQELATGYEIDDANRRALDKWLHPNAATKSVLSFRIWKDDVVVYSDRQELIGKTFKRTPGQAKAWQGTIVGDLDILSDEHSAGHDMRGRPVLEMYAPVYRHGTNEVIALAETYELATDLLRTLNRSRTESWMIVGAVTIGLIGSLFSIVSNGSRTIAVQRTAMQQRVNELSALLAENDDLRARVNTANQRMAEANERLLRRVGAELHDGPVQLLGLSLMKLDDFCDLVEQTDATLLTKSDAPDILRDALAEALHEIRHLSRGLAPPDIEKLSIGDALRLAVRKHENRTGSKVECSIDPQVDRLLVPFAVKTCLFRFAQEGLNNAFHHANGIDQRLAAECTAGKVRVRVDDSGPGFAVGAQSSDGGGQGLRGLRDRVELLGGTFDVNSEPGRGTTLLAEFEAEPDPSEA